MPRAVFIGADAAGHGGIKATAVLAWLGTVISGLLAGNSARTGTDSGQTSPKPSIARIGGFLFIAGAIAVLSTATWLLLRQILVDIIDPVAYWSTLTQLTAPSLWLIFACVLSCAFLFSWRFDLDTFGLNQFYRNRLVRCYLGATRWQPGTRHPHPFTAFDDGDDLLLKELRFKTEAERFCGETFRGPFPVINCTLIWAAVRNLAVHTRRARPCFFTPLYCGANRKKVGFARPIPTQAASRSARQCRFPGRQPVRIWATTLPRWSPSCSRCSTCALGGGSRIPASRRGTGRTG